MFNVIDTRTGIVLNKNPLNEDEAVVFANKKRDRLSKFDRCNIQFRKVM